MKTSGVSSGQPVDAKTPGKTKAEKKGEPKHEFKQVLEKSGSQAAGIQKGGHQIPVAKKPFRKEEEKEGAEKKTGAEKSVRSEQHTTADRRLGRRSEQESKEEKKLGKELNEEKPYAVPPNILMGPSTVQQKAALEKMESKGGLNIKEIESIVQRVQVGVNEQGLPEMQFELSTKNLGDLGLKVSADGDKIRIHFVTQDAATQNELEKNLQELSRTLESHGLMLAETKFMTRDQQSQERQQSGDQEDSRPEDFESIKPAARRRKPGDSGPGFTL